MTLIKLGAWMFASLLFVGMLLAVSTQLTTPSNTGSAHLSDKDLQEIFRLHKTEFDGLIKMSNVDSKVIRIANDFTWLDTNANWPRPDSEIGFSKARWEEYRKAFKKLGLKHGLLRPMDSETIFLIASSTGAVTSGSSKGYAYSMKELSPIVESLESISPELRTQRTVFKKLENDWYLFFQGS
jgi:hypothetical protein